MRLIVPARKPKNAHVLPTDVHDTTSPTVPSQRPRTIFLEFAAARYDDPATFLGRMVVAGFALGRVHLKRGVAPSSAEAILAAALPVDQMLVLTR